jgi:hypothetical protein
MLPPCGVVYLSEGKSSMIERQRRTDETTANAVARGLNILGVRNALLARRYMRHKGVPDAVIVRVIAQPEARRRESSEQSVITPTPPGDA